MHCKISSIYIVRIFKHRNIKKNIKCVAKEKFLSLYFAYVLQISFYSIPSILKGIKSAEFAVESIICRRSFKFCRFTHLYISANLRSCAPFQIIQFRCGSAKKLSYVSEKLFQFTSLTTEETLFSTVSIEYDIKRIGK